jgi:hypothetical protein
MDKKTLEKLLKEAKKNHKHYTKEFENYDNSDDMYEMRRWRETVAWLEDKLTEVNNERS